MPGLRAAANRRAWRRPGRVLPALPCGLILSPVFVDPEASPEAGFLDSASSPKHSACFAKPDLDFMGPEGPMMLGGKMKGLLGDASRWLPCRKTEPGAAAEGSPPGLRWNGYRVAPERPTRLGRGGEVLERVRADL